MSSVNVSIILRNDLAENWLSKDPILAKGEIGAENDTNLMKMGDGVHNYSELPYMNVVPAALNDKVSKTGDIITGALTLNYTPNNDSDAVTKGYVDSAINNLPVASPSLIGGVLSSSDDNSVFVNNTGKMTINRVSVNNLFVPDGDEFVLVGGTA